MSGFCHCIKGVSFVVFKHGRDDQSKQGSLFVVEARGEVCEEFI